MISTYMLKRVYFNASISHGTLKQNDVFEACIGVLAEHNPGKAAALQAKWHDADEETQAYLLNEDLFDALNDLAPEGYYFGAHPGDGSDFGYWQIEEE